MRPRSTRTPLTVAVLAAITSLALLAGPQVTTAGADVCRFAKREARDLGARKARKAVRCVVNDRRHDYGLRSLSTSDRLQRAASRHSRVMTALNCFAHQCPGEGSLATRLWSVGYLLDGLSSWGYGENIAWGQGDRSTPRRIVAAWMGSPPHRYNILNRGFEHVGVGFKDEAPTGGDANAGTYTLDFGYRG